MGQAIAKGREDARKAIRKTGKPELGRSLRKTKRVRKVVNRNKGSKPRKK
jgi:hypothetical protein